MRVPFRQRNPVPIGLASIAIIALVLVLAMNLQHVPLISGGSDHQAAFAEAAGLKKGEEVRIAGVKVGQVTSLDLDDRGYVRVGFRVDDGVRLGELTRAEIKIKTLLGAHYLALDPRGPGSLKRQIPLDRTVTPFEVVPAINELSQRVDKIDTAQVAKSFQVLSDTFENSPEEIQASLRGLRRLSETISSRDEELHELAGRAKNVTQLLADRNEDFTRLIQDGDKILQAVQARRAVIHQLLVNTVVLSQQINALIAENEDQLKPLLSNLQKVGKVLLNNQANLDRTIQLLAPYARQFADATGSGRWFDNYIQNLLPIPASIRDNDQHKQTQQNGQRGNNPLPFLP